MLHISREQFSLFEAAAMERANTRLVQYTRERFPELTDGKHDAGLAAFVSRVREHANRHDITHEADIATALDLTVMYGFDFYREAWVRDVFSVAEWSGAYKLEIIRERVRRVLSDF